MNQYIITKEHIHEILNILETEQYEKVHAVLRKLHPYQSERDTVLDDVDKILNCRTELMEELFDELRDPAVAKHSLQQIEIIRSRVNDLRDMKAGEP